MAVVDNLEALPAALVDGIRMAKEKDDIQVAKEMWCSSGACRNRPERIRRNVFCACPRPHPGSCSLNQ
jgi:hypothetical protein